MLRREKIPPHPPAPSPRAGEGEQEKFIQVFLVPLALLGRGARGEGFRKSRLNSKYTRKHKGCGTCHQNAIAFS